MRAMTLQHPLMPTRRQIGLLLASSTLLSGRAQANAPDWEEVQIATADGPMAYAVAGQGPLLVVLQGDPAAAPGPFAIGQRR